MFDHRLLNLIEQRPELSQRELAEQLGVSLGKTHYLLKALIEKGLVKVGNFRRNDNKVAYLYQLTPSGLIAKVELAQAFLGRKEAEYEALHAEISALRTELSKAGGEAAALPIAQSSVDGA